LLHAQIADLEGWTCFYVVVCSRVLLFAIVLTCRFFAVPHCQVADPEDACSPFTFSDTQQTWVALISRSQQLHPTNCTFDVKVRRSADVTAALQQHLPYGAATA
jgi:hypothetical protein